LSRISSENATKELTIEIPFITTGTCSVSLITDGADAKNFATQLTSFKAGEQIKLKMLGFGGFVAMLKENFKKVKIIKTVKI